MTKWEIWASMPVKALIKEYRRTKDKDLRYIIWELTVGLRRFIRTAARKAVRLVTDVLAKYVLVTEYHLRICTPVCPMTHWNIHNSPVRFIREGL